MLLVMLLMIKSAPLIRVVTVIMMLVTIRLIVVALLMTRVTYALRVVTPLMSMERVCIERVERDHSDHEHLSSFNNHSGIPAMLTNDCGSDCVWC